MSVLVGLKNSSLEENNISPSSNGSGTSDQLDSVMNFIGEYKLEKDDNFDEFLKTIDVPYVARKLVAACKPIQTISLIDGGYFRITCVMIRVFNYCIEFKEGEEFEEKIFSGEVVKKVITRDQQNRWIETQVSGKHTGMIYIRELDSTGLLTIVSTIPGLLPNSFIHLNSLSKQTCIYKGVTGRRFFRKLWDNLIEQRNI